MERQERDYVKLEKKKFIPQEKGIILTAFLKDYFTKYVEYDFTDKELVALTDDTKSVLDTLDKDITIYVSGSEKDIDDFESKYLNN